VSGVLVTAAALAHLRWDSRSATPRPLVVLLHGVGGGREAWGAAGSGSGAALAAAGFTAMAVDFPGYGLSAPVDPCDLAGMAAVVARLIDPLGLGPALRVSHSMGDMVAQALTARLPQAAVGLVLASSSPAFGKPGGDWQRDFLQSRFAPLDAGAGMAGMAGMAGVAGMAGLAAQRVPAMLAPDSPAWVRANAQPLMASVPESTYRSAVAARVAFDRRANLPLIKVPTRVITGELDKTAAPRWRARWPSASLARCYRPCRVPAICCRSSNPTPSIPRCWPFWPAADVTGDLQCLPCLKSPNALPKAFRKAPLKRQPSRLSPV
jgi:3-oxoadipate enol-lactonase